MPLYFHNGRGHTLWAAWGMWYPGDCPGELGGFIVKGWFEFRPGEAGMVSSDDMRGGSYLTYGIWSDNYPDWSGERPVTLPNLRDPFERCIAGDIFLNGRTIKFKEFPRYNGTHHVTFA